MKHERLTETEKINKYCSMVECGEHCEDCYVGNLYNRLAELEDKIENGTLIELPCKVGDKIWYIDKNYTIQQAEVTCIDIRTTSRHIIATRYVLEKEDTIKIALMFEDFNVDYWLTKAEAEAKLKELKGEV